MKNQILYSQTLLKLLITVSHDILLCKLEHYGIKDTILSWFKS